MNDLVLTLSIRWLEAKDAFSASCVSFEWQNWLTGDRDHGELWKQIFVNSFPLLADTTGSNDGEDVDYRLLTLGLWDGVTPMTAEEATRLTPTLGPNDFFAVVELYR